MLTFNEIFVNAQFRVLKLYFKYLSNYLVFVIEIRFTFSI